MYWTRVKIGAVVLLTSLLAGISATLWATQRSEAEPPEEVAPEPRGGPARAGQPEDAARTAREMAQSRLHLRKLAQAMQAYLEKNGHFPPPAIYGKDGKALLSWRVALLPYLDQNNLYKQFHLDEPWDSPHNREWSNTVPKVYAPPGRPITLPMRTYYQVFVSAPARAGAAPGPGGAGGSAPGGAGPMGGTGASAPPGAGGGAPGVGGPGGPGAPIGGFAAAPGESAWPAAAFVKGRGVGIAHISDGTSNTILIVEAGNPVPWTKPEDLHYATDEPLPELGGLFRDVFHAAFADGSVHTLTKKYDEVHLRTVITANAGDITDYGKIEASPRRGRESPVVEEPSGGGWQQRNDALRRQLERERERLRLLREERDVQREQSARQQSRPTDPHEEALRRENARLQSELDKVRAESEALEKEITRLQKPVQRKGP